MTTQFLSSMFMYSNYYFWGIILIPGILLGLYAQIKVVSTYNTYKNVAASSGITAKDAAQKLLMQNNITDIKIIKTSGELTDHYNYKKQTVALSAGVHDSTSISALGIMAHELGHVMQYKSGYLPLKVRNILIPVSNFVSSLLWPVLFLGILFNFVLLFNPLVGTIFIYSGIAMFGLIALISLITLPVEINASKRARKLLLQSNLIEHEEIGGVKKVLSAAAMTYVAALIMSLLNLLRFIIVFTDRR